MKKRLKKITTIVLTVTMMMSVTMPAFADNVSNVVLMEKAETVQNMSDAEFDKFIVEYMNAAQNENKTTTQINEELSQLNIEYVSNMSNIVESRAISSSTGLTPSIYTMKRGNEDFYRIYAQAKFNQTETMPGAEDIMTLEWDKDKAKYVSSFNGDFTSRRHESDPDNGIIVYNVSDNEIVAGDIAYGVVRVTVEPEVTDIALETTFHHTYDTTTVTWTTNVSLNVGTALNGGGSVTLTGSNKGLSISFWADNTFKYTD